MHVSRSPQRNEEYIHTALRGVLVDGCPNERLVFRNTDVPVKEMQSLLIGTDQHIK